MPTVIDEYAALPGRIAAAAQHVEDARTALANELERRDDLIVQAIDQAGMKYAAVAKAAGLTAPQIVRIMSRSSADDD